MDADAIIVGGGIGGAVLANLLAREGKRAIVLEKNPTPIRIERPEVLWPATLKILSSILPAEKLKSATLPIAGLEFSRSGTILLSFRTPAASTNPAAGACFTDPNLTRQALLETGAFELRRGVTITRLLRENTRVVGVELRESATGALRELRCQWVIGDDGGHSIVRQQCGIALEPTPLPVILLCFAYNWPSRFEPGVARGFVNERWRESGIPLMAAAPFPGGRGIALNIARAHALDDPARAREEWALFMSNNPDAAEVFGSRRYPEDLIRFQTAYGNAPSYGVDGAFLMGDAAHPVTPAGGQGANLSVADAASLSQILPANKSDALKEYEHQRRPAAQRSLRMSRGAAKAFSLPDTILSRLLPTALRIIGLRPQFFSAIVSTPATAFVADQK